MLRTQTDHTFLARAVELARRGYGRVQPNPVVGAVVARDGEVLGEGWHDDFAVGYGATFNLSHDLMQMLSFRPRNRFNDTEGLYLVGGGTHPGSGLPVIYEGARITTRLIQEDLGLALVGSPALAAQ